MKLRKSSLIDEHTNSLFLRGFESYFETLKPECEDRERKLSFIDLMSEPKGMPEVKRMQLPSMNAVQSEIEEYTITEGGTSHAENNLDLLLDQCMPSTLNQDPNENKKNFEVTVVIRKLSPYLIGTLTLEERQAKLAKYKEKRKRRSFAKRISYDCRKKVADTRLRIKGRFVAKTRPTS